MAPFSGFVPGRIEVLGRHTDYAGGRSLVCAIDRGFTFTAQPGSDAVVRLREDEAEFPAVEFPLSAELAPRVGHWSNYPMTMARRFALNFGAGRRLRGADIDFSSTLPVGSGMSGSSALMMMVFTVLAVVNDARSFEEFRANIRDPLDLSVYCACAENGQSFRGLSGDRGVGTFGGSEDHAAIIAARPGSLSLFRFCPASLEEEIPWPPEWAMVVAFSGVRAEKTRDALEKYNMVSRRAREAAAVVNRLTGADGATLREALGPMPPSARLAAPMAKALDASSSSAAPGLADRARQFLLEDGLHIPGAVQALRRRDLEGFGRMLSASHRASLRYLWNIAPEVDSLARSAVRLGAAGASGFGAGFGGSIVAVARAAEAEGFMESWRRWYAERNPARSAEAAFFIASPGSGISLRRERGGVRLVDLLFQS